MKLSLPLRLFLVHLVFTIGAGYASVVLVARSFERYAESWQREVARSFAADLYRPLAAEVARSLLLAQEAEFPEVRDERRARIMVGLRAVLKDLRGIRSIVVVDRDLRIQFASDPAVSDLAYTKPDDRTFLQSESVASRPAAAEHGLATEEVVIPVFDESPRASARRLGAVLVRVVPDAALFAQVSPRPVRTIPWKSFALPVILFLAASATGGVAVAALTGLPVRRLQRALEALRAKDYRGRLDARSLGGGGELASAVQAINELGGRLEALDARGREREALLQTLSQSLEDGMVALAPDGKPVAWNRSAERILGAHASESGDLGASLEQYPGWLDRVRAGEGSFELQLPGSDGSARAIKVTALPFEARPGEHGTLLLLRDVATLRTVEAHLVDAGRFAVLAHLGAGLAHEIRNPLHSIGLNASVVEQYVGGTITAQRKVAMLESLSTIREETDRLAELLNGYLGMVRADAVPGAIDVYRVFNRVRQLLAFPARKARVVIRIDDAHAVPPVHGLADRIQQALVNLVLNAIQAMPEGGEVVLAARTTGEGVRVSVADTGPGVPPAARSTLFVGGVTTKAGGTGLGLPLVRMIAESHGGSVAYESGSPHGAVFVLVLPISAAA